MTPEHHPTEVGRRTLQVGSLLFHGLDQIDLIGPFEVFSRLPELLPLWGAIPGDDRVVVDDTFMFAAGVTAGIDGALRVAADLRGDEQAQAIQLWMQYAPEPPFTRVPLPPPPRTSSRPRAARSLT